MNRPGKFLAEKPKSRDLSSNADFKQAKELLIRLCYTFIIGLVLSLYYEEVVEPKEEFQNIPLWAELTDKRHVAVPKIQDADNYP